MVLVFRSLPMNLMKYFHFAIRHADTDLGTHNLSVQRQLLYWLQWSLLLYVLQFRWLNEHSALTSFRWFLVQFMPINVGNDEFQYWKNHQKIIDMPTAEKKLKLMIKTGICKMKSVVYNEFGTLLKYIRKWKTLVSNMTWEHNCSASKNLNRCSYSEKKI